MPGWAGTTVEERRAERRRALVQAGFTLLGEDGWAATSVRGVCARAKLNPRYFYESFADLDALVVAVYDQVVAELGVAVTEAQDVAPKRAAAQLAATIDATVRYVDEDRRRGRVLYVEAIGNEALARRRVQAERDLVDALGRDLPPDGHEPSARLGAAVLVGGFRELLVAWLDGRITLSREELVEDATSLFLGLGRATSAVSARRRRVQESA